MLWNIWEFNMQKQYGIHSSLIISRWLTCVCLCVCSSQAESLCVLNVNIGVIVPMSLCSFHAGRCHKDPLFFISEGACGVLDEAKLEWAIFRANVSSKSSVQEPCDLDTCYEWETCSGEILLPETIFSFTHGSNDSVRYIKFYFLQPHWSYFAVIWKTWQLIYPLKKKNSFNQRFQNFITNL